MRAFVRAAVAAVFLVCGLALVPVAARSQATPPCWPVTVFERSIATVGEDLVAVGMSGSEQVRFYVNRETRSWTVVAISPEGQACLVAIGDNLEFTVPPRGSLL